MAENGDRNQEDDDYEVQKCKQLRGKFLFYRINYTSALLRWETKLSSNQYSV